MTTKIAEEQPWCVERARLVAAAIRSAAQSGEAVSLPIRSKGLTTGPATIALALEEFADLTEELPDFVLAVKRHINEGGGAGGYLLARLDDVETKMRALNIDLRHRGGTAE